MKIINNQGSALTQMNIVIIVLSLCSIFGYSYVDQRFLKNAKIDKAVHKVKEIVANEKENYSTSNKYIYIGKSKQEQKKFKTISINVGKSDNFDYWVEKYDSNGFQVHARTTKDVVEDFKLPPRHYTHRYIDGKEDKGKWRIEPAKKEFCFLGFCF